MLHTSATLNTLPHSAQQIYKAMDTSGLTPLFDAEGKFIWNTLEYNGHKVYPFPNIKNKLDSYMKSFPVLDDDIYLPTYSKSGSHWLCEIVMMLTRRSADYRKEKTSQNMLEFWFDPEAKQNGGRRVMITHLQLGVMPPDILNNSSGKFIQIHRNPADLAVSFFNHLTNLTDIAGHLTHDWNSFITEIFCDRDRMNHPTWWDYTSEWWTAFKDKPNYLPVFYEELKEHPVKVIGDIAEFLKVGVDQKLVEEIATRVSFDRMSGEKRKIENHGPVFQEGFTFYRKGIVGDWKTHFTKEQHEQFMNHHNKELRNIPELYQRFIQYLQP
ncbi:sulfotransferase 1B1-like [Watersipora subatra]|uniref:sulfotransferase 1B1-like n=1 Tax=Watersipora subatra TaxID=2589382 RepID=UPI00355B2BAC